MRIKAIHTAAILFLTLFSGFARGEQTCLMVAPTYQPGTYDNFNAQLTTGSYSYGEGSAYYGYSGINRYRLNAGSGSYNSRVGVDRYGITFGAFQMFQGIITPNFFTVVSSNSNFCSSADNSAQSFNWILVRARTPDVTSTNVGQGPMDATASTFEVGGTFTYNPTSNVSFTSTGYFGFDGVANAASFSLDRSVTGGCLNGVMKTVANPVPTLPSNGILDKSGNVYLDKERFVYIGTGGNPVVAVGAKVEDLNASTKWADLSRNGFSGIYTEFLTGSTQTKMSVLIVPSTVTAGTANPVMPGATTTVVNGTEFYFYEMPAASHVSAYSNPSLDISAGSYRGKFTCATAARNTPSNGFCKGKLYASDGVTNAEATCLFGTAPSYLMSCMMQKPGTPSKAVSILATVPTRSILAVSVSPITSELASAGTALLTATVTNLTGKEATAMGDPALSVDRLAAPFSYDGLGAYATNGGTCGTTLRGFTNCTVKLKYTPTQDGAVFQTYKIAYNNGSTVVNATAPLRGMCGLKSLAISGGYGYMVGSLPTLTALAQFNDGNVQDVSAAVSWGNLESLVADTVNGSTTLTVASSAGLMGKAISGPGIPLGATVTAIIDATHVQISAAATLTASAAQLYSTNMEISASSQATFLSSGDQTVKACLGVFDANGSCPGSSGLLVQKTLTINPYAGSFGQVVLGQANVSNVQDFTASAPNSVNVIPPGATTTPSSASLKTPRHMYSDGKRFIVADSLNHRALIWDTVPVSSFTATRTSGSAILSAISPTDMARLKAGVVISGTGVVANSTILSVNAGASQATMSSNATASGTSVLGVFRYAADSVLGQTTMNLNTQLGFTPTPNSNVTNATASTLGTPTSVWIGGNRAAVYDTNFNRVLLWDSITDAMTPGTAADIVLGQPDFTCGSINTGSSCNTPSPAAAANTIYSYLASRSGLLAYDGMRLIVSDPQNNRVLVWNKYPVSSFTGTRAGTATITGVSASDILNVKVGAVISGTGVAAGTLINSVNVGLGEVVLSAAVTGSGSTVFRMNRHPADVVLGQANFSGNLANRGAQPSAVTIKSPGAVYSDGTRLFVVDAGNRRVLVWKDINAFPLTSGAPADVVLGQSTSNSDIVLYSQSGMGQPEALHSDGKRLFVADGTRVLVYNDITALSTGMLADQVYGEPNFNSFSGGLSATSFGNVSGVFSDGTDRLYVSDYNNSRVLSIALTGSGAGSLASLSIGDSSYDYGSVVPGLAKEHLFLITNSGKTPATSVAFTFSGSGVPYNYKGGSFPGTSGTCTTNGVVLPNSSCTINVAFSPPSGATLGTSYPGTLTLNYNNGSGNATPVVSNLSGTADKAVLLLNDGATNISAGTYGYGTAIIGTPVSKVFTLTNTSTTKTATTLQATANPANLLLAPFAFAGTGGYFPGVGGTCSTSLAAGASCTVVVAFNPSAAVAYSGAGALLEFTYFDGATNKLLNTALTGTGSASSGAAADVSGFVGTFTANSTSGSNLLVSASSVAGLSVGKRISGSGIPTDTSIAAISGTTITMSANATATATGVTVTVASANSISLSWVAPSPLGYTSGYKLVWLQGSIPASTCSTGTVVSGVSSGVSHTVTGLSPGLSYTFRLCSLNSLGAASAGVTTTVSTTALPPNVAPLSFPAKNSSQVVVNWTAAGGSAVGYRIVYGTSTTAASCSGATIAELGNVTTYTLSSLTSSTLYYVRVCSYDSAGNYSTGQENTVTPPAIPGNPASLVSTFPASTTSGSSTITSTANLSYLYPGDLISGSGIPVGTTIVSTKTGTFTGTTTNLGKVLTAVSSTANVQTGANITGTGIPANTKVVSFTANTVTMSAAATSTAAGSTITHYLTMSKAATATAGPITVSVRSSNIIHLSWPAGSGAAGYRLAYAWGNSAPSYVGLEPCSALPGVTVVDVGNVLTYNVSGLTSNQAYSFRLCPYSSSPSASSGLAVDFNTGATLTASTSANSGAANDPTSPVTLAPVAPSAVKLSWTAPATPSPAVSGYKISFWPYALGSLPYNCAPGPNINLVDVGNVTTSPDIILPTALTLYQFRICSYDSSGTSDGSPGLLTTATGGPQAIPSTTSVAFSWPQSVAPTAGYMLARLTGTTAPVACGATLTATSATYTFSPAMPMSVTVEGRVYTYTPTISNKSDLIMVAQLKLCVNGSTGANCSGTGKGIVPTNTLANVISGTNKLILQQKNSTALSFTAGTGLANDSVTLVDAGNGTGYTATGLTANTDYTFRQCSYESGMTNLSTGAVVGVKTNP